MLINTGNISRKVLSKVLRSFVKNFERLQEQDIYLLGVKSAEQEFTGKVIAVYHRYDDNETKWIVVPCDDEGIVLEDVEIPTDNEIYAQIAFQEQFFSGVLVK